MEINVIDLNNCPCNFNRRRRGFGSAFGVKFLAVVALSINKTIRDLSEKSNLDADRKYRDSILTESLRKLWLTVNRLPEKFAR